jgi:hypothetical protein
MHEDFTALPPALQKLGADLDAAMRVVERKKSARRARPLTGLALAAAIGGAVVVFFGLGLAGHGGLLTAPVPVADALDRAAQAALDAPSLMPRDDQYFYVREQGTNLLGGAHGAIALLTESSGRWISADRPNVSEEAVTSVYFPSPRDKRLLGPVPLTVQPSRQSPPIGGYYVADRLLTRAQVLRYPTSPHAIYQRLRHGIHDASPTAAADEVFTEIGDSLRDSPIPPSLRSGFYGALALVPGLRLTADARDALGRVGVAASIIRAGVKEELIFDPGTADMLAERQVVLSPATSGLAAKRGMVIEDVTYLGWAITNKAPKVKIVLGPGKLG